MPKSEHVRAAMEDEALELAEEVYKRTKCDCDLGYRCIYHRAGDYLEGYDRLVVLIAWEAQEKKRVDAWWENRMAHIIEAWVA